MARRYYSSTAVEPIIDRLLDPEDSPFVSDPNYRAEIGSHYPNIFPYGVGGSGTILRRNPHPDEAYLESVLREMFRVIYALKIAAMQGDYWALLEATALVLQGDIAIQKLQIKELEEAGVLPEVTDALWQDIRKKEHLIDRIRDKQEEAPRVEWRAKANPGPRGGFVGQERARLPDSYFLEPSTRSWPVGDPQLGMPDETHAKIALQYMTRGFGNRGRYYRYIMELGRRYPPHLRQNRDIWTTYLRLKPGIERKAGREMPSLDEISRHRAA